jgi:hypothetical protein
MRMALPFGTSRTTWQCSQIWDIWGVTLIALLPTGMQWFFEAVAQAISKVSNLVWTHHTKAKQACTHSKPWWDTDCTQAKDSAMLSDLPANWMAFKKSTNKAKCKHFDEHIDKIAHTNLQPWNLMDWVGPHTTPPVGAISCQGMPCTSPDQLWNVLHSTFNSALDRPVDMSMLGDKWESSSTRVWVPYSTAEMSDGLMGTSNQSAPRLDHITWQHLKCIVRDGYMSHLSLWLANSCLQSSHCPADFKASIMVAIVVVFFRPYLVDWFTCYAWDNDLSPEFPSSVGVGQGSALFFLDRHFIL